MMAKVTMLRDFSDGYICRTSTVFIFEEAKRKIIFPQTVLDKSTELYDEKVQ